MSLSELSAQISPVRTVVILIAVALIASLDVFGRYRKKSVHYFFACLFGTAVSLGLITCARLLLKPGVAENGHIMALGVILLVVAWRMMFGSWEPPVKATVLGTFIFWLAFTIISQETGEERIAHFLAMAVALIPAVIWAALFLEYHRERLSMVFLMFFAGMASTVPILFYDQLVRHNVQLKLFFVRVIPESFNQAARSFVTGQFPGLSSIGSTLAILFVSALLVGLIEEVSKYWVLRRSGEQFFASIDDVMQLAIIVAIGFAFAENVTNSGYFLNFVREYLATEKRDWVSFLGNVAGRAVLTNMVHIVSTGVTGYFLGLTIFAQSCLQEAAALGRPYTIVETLHRLFQFPRKTVFRIQMLTSGILLASILHGLSNFMVTLPEGLPGSPRSLGDLLGAPDGSLWNYVSLLLFPWLLYVVGGFWLLTILFFSKQNMKERGRLVTADTFVTPHQAL